MSQTFFYRVVLSFLAFVLLCVPIYLFAATIPDISDGMNFEDNLIEDWNKNTFNAIYLPPWKEEIHVAVSILVVNSFQALSPEEYAMQAFEKWSALSSTKRDGFILVASPFEKRGAFYLGENVQKIIPKELPKLIIERELVPNLEKGPSPVYTNAAVQDSAKALVHEFRDRKAARVSAYKGDDTVRVLVTFLIRVLEILGLIFCYALGFIASKTKSPLPILFIGMLLVFLVARHITESISVIAVLVAIGAFLGLWLGHSIFNSKKKMTK